jgi:hypothetical protein
MVPSHFNATAANVPTRAVQGRKRYALARRQSRIPTTSRPLATFSGGGSWAEPFGRRPIGGFPRRRGGRLYGRNLIRGFAFLIPASTACARSLLVPGTCDLTHRWADASDSAAPCAWNSPTIPAP